MSPRRKAWRSKWLKMDSCDSITPPSKLSEPRQNLLLIRGSVPGANGALVLVRKSVKTTKAQQQKTAEKK